MNSNTGEVVLVKDINPGPFPNSSYPADFIEFNDKLYFRASDPEAGSELWVSDGTAEGTQLLVDISPGGDFGDSSFPEELTESNGNLYFRANDGDSENGEELWVTDGTAQGTRLVADIYPGNDDRGYVNNSLPQDLTEYNGKLYFRANDGENGRELWVSDGTAEGTQLLIDINPSTNDLNGSPNSSFPTDLTEFDGKLYFRADDGENGNELWVTDGTAEGTQLVADINPGSSDGSPNSSYPADLTEFDGKLYFTANDGKNGGELWVSDGTAEGTQLVADIRPGSSDNGFAYGSFPSGFTEFNGELYFTANDGENGEELWVTDGTAEGTQLVADIRPGGLGSFVTDLTEFNGELYFGADNGEIGRELYKLTFDDVVEPGEPNLIEGTQGDDTIEGTEGDDRIKGFSGDDVIFALGGNDTVFGDIFSDNLDGGDGDDDVLGGLGNDTLNGGNGDDMLVGKEGNDFFVLTQGEGTDTIADFEPGQDIFVLSNGLRFEDLTLTENQIQVGDSVLAVVEGVDTSTLSPSNFNEEEPTEPNLIEGTSGDDTIEGTEGDDRIKGFSGNDVIFALGGNDTVFGDIFSDELDGGDGDDDLLGGLGNDTLNGGNGNDLLVGREGNDFFVLTPNEGEDTITDFDLESDRLVLGGGLTFEDLSFSNDSILVNEETLATVRDIDTTALTADNFV